MYTLFKTISKNSIADAVYKEINTRSSRFYHYFGKTDTWVNDTEPFTPIDSLSYERSVRDSVVIMKEIAPSDVSYVLPRIDWTTSTIYDEYDSYSTEITGINLIAGGTGYSSPVVTIGTVVPTSTVVALNAQYFYVYSGNSIGYLYTVTTAGTTGASNSVLGVSTPIIGQTYTHGTVVLTCVGYQATATATLGSGAYSSSIVSVSMTYNGSGYNSIPLVSITGGVGLNASAIAIMTVSTNNTYSLESSNYYALSGSNVYICIDNNNRALSTVAPTGTTSSPFTTADGYIWKYMCTVPANSNFLTTSYIPIITANKNKYSPTGSIVSANVDNGGTGYTTASISVSGDGINASLTPQITDGIITGVIINNAGTGYSYTNITVSGDGKGASVSAGLFTGVVPDNAQSVSESSVIDGYIVSTQVVSGGYGYSSATVTIAGNGSGATATALIVNGRLSSIRLTNAGSGYSWATVTITGDGYGASARAILSPYGGLGKDPVNHLCARSLMFVSYISSNLIHNVTSAAVNDYRQIGIIKDPVRYGDKYTLAANFATTCWKVTASAPVSGISADNIVTATINSTVYRFRIETVSGSDVLLIPIDSGIPAVGLQFTLSTDNTKSFIASTVIPPTVDKYSGDLISVTNNTPMSLPVIRSVINF